MNPHSASDSNPDIIECLDLGNYTRYIKIAFTIQNKEEIDTICQSRDSNYHFLEMATEDHGSK